MHIQLTKKELETALQVAYTSVSSSGEKIDTHILFRIKDDKVQVLSFAGRLFSMTPVATVDQAGAVVDKFTSFTVEAKRLKTWLSAVPDDQAPSFDFDGTVVTASVNKGSMDFQSLDPATFPYWDLMLNEVTEAAKMPASRLSSALGYVRPFVSDEENKNPELCVTEVKDGILYATDKKAATLVEVVGLTDSKMRVHGGDVPAVLKFLSTCGEGDVEVLEHERAVLFRREDGAVFGEARFQAEFPSLPINRDVEYAAWWTIPKSEIRDAIPFLTSGAQSDDDRVRFKWDDAAKTVTLSMKGATGKDQSLSFPCREHGGDNVKGLPAKGFMLSYPSLLKVCAGWTAEDLKFGVVVRGATGYVCFREERQGDDYLTITAWLRE